MAPVFLAPLDSVMLRLGIDKLPDIDATGTESGLAIGEVELPDPVKTVVEAHRLDIRPARAIGPMPGGQGSGIAVGEHLAVDRNQAGVDGQGFKMRNGWQHAAGEDVFLDKVDR